jgi:hypothetical protein
MITAHLATIPDRLDILPGVLESLSPLVNHVFVALNGHKDIVTTKFTNVTFRFCSNEVGDAHKFEFINEVEGLVLVTDDDLTWSREAIELLVRKAEQYKCPVSLHGKAYPRPYRSFKCFSGNYRCLNTVIGDHPVDVIGTGTLMFNTDMVKVSMSMFQSPNMADVWFSKLCKKQGVPLMVIEHQAGIVGYLNPKTTIWQNTKSYALHDSIIKDFLK